MFSRYYFLTLSVALFNSFLSLLWFFLLSLVLTFLHFLLSSILLIISCVIHGFLALFSTFPTRPLIVSNTHCSPALRHSHCHIQLHQVSLLEYPALFVVEHIISPNPIVVFSFGTLQFSSIWCRSWQLVSCGQSQYLPQAVSAHPSHCFLNLCFTRILATSKLWSESISAPDSVCTSFTLFLNLCFTSM